MKWENVELRFKLYWLAPSYDGGLPLEYCFKYRDMSHVRCHPSSYFSVENGMYSSFFELNNRFNRHTIWIEARNSVGSAQSPSVVAFLSMEIESSKLKNTNHTIIIRIEKLHQFFSFVYKSSSSIYSSLKCCILGHTICIN